MTLVHVTRRDRWAEIVLDRPQAHNAISSALARDVLDACREVGEAGADAVVLRSSSPRAFCVGADLKERAGFSDADLMRQRQLFRACFAAVRHLPVPAIAAVHGFALGGGLELALSCDLIVADETAVLGLPEAKVGLVPGGGGTQLLLRRVGPARAADLVYTGRHVGAEEAAALGLVDRLVPPGQDATAAAELAALIAANSPVALRQAKRALTSGHGIPLEAALDVEDAAWRAAATSPDRVEGIAAFNERRSPVWPEHVPD